MKKIIVPALAAGLALTGCAAAETVSADVPADTWMDQEESAPSGSLSAMEREMVIDMWDMFSDELQAEFCTAWSIDSRAVYDDFVWGWGQTNSDSAPTYGELSEIVAYEWCG